MTAVEHSPQEMSIIFVKEKKSTSTIGQIFSDAEA